MTKLDILTATDDTFVNTEPSLSRRFFGSTTFMVAVVVVALIVLFSILSPGGVFATPGNFRNLALDSAQLILLAVGMTFLIGAGELDLSIGANVILSSVVAGSAINTITGAGAPEWLGIIVGLIAGIATGAAFGLVNALLVNLLKVNSFVVSLATLSVGTGVAYIITNGINITSLPRVLQSGIGAATIGGVVPITAVVAVIVGLIAAFVLRKLRFGVHTLAVGSDARAATRAGISVKTHRIRLFLLMGGIAGLVGFLDISRFLTTNIQGHTGDALAAIAAVVIGGASLMGGRASIPGAMVAALIPAILTNGLVIMRVGAFYQLVVIGVILLVAVGIDQWRRVQSTR